MWDQRTNKGREMRITVCTFTVLSFAIIGLSSFSYAQSSPDSLSADERFDLNIAFEQITETDFRRSTSVSLNAENLRVHTGAVVEASRITVTLRGVTGQVRFKASLEPIRQSLERRRAKMTTN
jgi:hypothetical protein